MAKHWSTYVGGISQAQAGALDKMARDAGKGDGMDLLMEVSGYSRSRVGKMDRLSLRPHIDECFARFSREAIAEVATEAAAKAEAFDAASKATTPVAPPAAPVQAPVAPSPVQPSPAAITAGVGALTYFRGTNVWITPALLAATFAAHGVTHAVPDLTQWGPSRAAQAATAWRTADGGHRAEVISTTTARRRGSSQTSIEIGILRRVVVSDHEVAWSQVDSVAYDKATGWTAPATTEGADFLALAVKWQTHVDYGWIRSFAFKKLGELRAFSIGGGGVYYVHSDEMTCFEALRAVVREIPGARLHALRIDASDPDSVDSIGSAAQEHALTQVGEVVARLADWRGKARGKTSTLEGLLGELVDVRGRALALAEALRFSTDEVESAIGAAEAELRETLRAATEPEAPAPVDAALETVEPPPAPVVPESTPELAPVVEVAAFSPAAEVVLDGPAAKLAQIPSVEILEGSTAKELRQLAHRLGIRGAARQAEAVIVSRILEVREELAAQV